MPFAGGMKHLYAAYHPGARARSFPNFDCRFPYCAGANLATAMQAIHSAG
jgi:DNA-binding helix-hairpin-helix protein with protein kinase domain